MDQHRELVLAQPERLGRDRVEHPRDALELDEVVAGPQRAELVGPARPRSLGHRGGIRSRQAALRLGALDVLRDADAVLGDEDRRALHQHAIERRTREPQRPAVAGAHRHTARDLVHERLAPSAELGRDQRQDEQPDAAVDVIADASRRDDAVGRLCAATPPTGKP